VHENLPLRRFEGAGRVNTVWAGNERFTPGHVCIASGAWTGEIARNLGFELSVKPIRGQIVLLKTPSKLFSRIVNVGPRYLVPREDGRILVGSTEEDVGFDPSTTAAAVSGLLDFALSQAPGLKQAEVERAWAGLRPATPDGLPYLGRVPGFDNLFVAAGHFRSGLSLSCASARVVGQLVRGAAAEVDLADFQVGRAEAHVSSSSPHR
jgi:glycine oxidase